MGATVMTLLLAACGGSGEEGEGEKVVANTAPIVGISLGPRVDGLEAMFRQEARERGLRLQVEQAYDKSEAQQTQLRRLVDSQLSCVVVFPVGPNVVLRARMDAQDAGVPLLMMLHGRNTPGACVILQDESAGRDLGRQAADQLMERNVKVPVVLIVEDRFWWSETQGFVNEVLAGLEETFSSLEVLARLRVVGDLDRDKSMIEATLAARRSVDLVLGADGTATRAVSLADRFKRSDRGPLILGVSDSKDVVERAKQRAPRHLILEYQLPEVVTQVLETAESMAAGGAEVGVVPLPLVPISGEDQDG